MGLAAVLLMIAACNLLSATTTTNNANVTVSGAPVVQIAAPLPNATYLENVAVNIQAAISNAGADVDRVEFAVDGATIATYPSPNPSGAAAFSLTQSWPIAGVGAHTISVTAYRKDGTKSSPTSVTITVVSAKTQPQVTATASGSGQPAGNTPAPQVQPTQPPQAQPIQPQPTQPPPATATQGPPMAKFTVGVNVRPGPDTVFNPPIGSYAANATAEITAVNPAGTWYKVKYYNGEGWVFGANVQVQGDISQLPRDPGPPTPIPTATPIPITNTPVSVVNLIVTGVSISPHPFVCNQASSIKVTVQNVGSGPSTNGGLIGIQDIVVSSSAQGPYTEIAFPALQPGQQFTGEGFLTVSTNTNELHRLIITVDSTNQVAETNEGDNQYGNNPPTDYQLQKGSCP
jgi:uncharacterized protein YraI